MEKRIVSVVEMEGESRYWAIKSRGCKKTDKSKEPIERMKNCLWEKGKDQQKDQQVKTETSGERCSINASKNL